jgi:exonuclease SbcC
VEDLNSRLAGSAADRLRLGRHDAGTRGRQLVQAREKVQEGLTATQSQLDAMIAEAPEIVARVETARQALTQANDDQQQAQLQRQTWKPILERARELDARIAGDRKVIGEIQGRLREAGAASTSHAGELFNTGVLLEAHRGVVAELEASRDKLAAVDDLDREAKGWEELAVRWGTARELLKQGESACRVAQERHGSAAAALQAEQARQLELTTRVSDLAADSEQARLRMDQLEPLDGRSPREVERAIQDRLRRAQREVDVLASRVRNATEAQAEADAAGARLLEDRDKLATARTEAAAATRAHEAATLALSQADDDLQAFQRLHTLVHHLADLHPDQPCFLCGSTVHDAGHVAELRDQLKDAGQQLESLKQRRTAAADARSATAAAVEKALRVCAELDAAIRQVDGQLEAATARIRTQLVEQEPTFGDVNELAQARQAADQQLVVLTTLDGEFRPAVEQWEALDRAAGDARAELAAAVAKLEQMTSTVRDLKLAADEAEVEQDRLKQAHDGVVAELEPEAARIRAWLTEAISHLGLEPQLKTSQLLSTVKRARLEVDSELVDRRHAVAATLQQQTMIKARLDELTETVREDEARAKSLDQTVRDLQRERDDILPGTTADEKEAELSTVEQAVQERLRAANGAVQKAVQEESEFRKRQHALEATGEQQRGQLTSMGAELSEAILGHGFADEADLMASSLSDDTAAELRTALEQLDREETRLGGELSAAVRRRDDAVSMALELGLAEGADPTSLTDRDWDAPLSAHRERLREIQQQVSELEQLAGGLNAQLNTLRERGERLARLQATRLQLQERHRQLKQLDELVGGEGGKKFETLALALMLDRLLAAANEWLTVFQPRYRLGNVHQAGLPTLDFEVVDQHTGNEARPLSTLSGGETFMVSLALALALSSTRNLPYRLETLLIDEGFGTLDPDTLAVVMNTLDQLQQRTGGTVAVISHVPGLADQIPAQIRVLKGPRGRSRVQAGIFSSTNALP